MRELSRGREWEGGVGQKNERVEIKTLELTWEDKMKWAEARQKTKVGEMEKVGKEIGAQKVNGQFLVASFLILYLFPGVSNKVKTCKHL